MVEGGLALFRFGPCSFSMDTSSSSSSDSHCFSVCVSEVVIRGGGMGAGGAASSDAIITTGQWLRWIDKYSQFCISIGNLLD